MFTIGETRPNCDANEPQEDAQRTRQIRRKRLNNETPEQRERRLQIQREQRRRRKHQETTEQRQHRLVQQRQRRQEEPAHSFTSNLLRTQPLLREVLRVTYF